jgi:hypothetical protein
MCDDLSACLNARVQRWWWRLPAKCHFQVPVVRVNFPLNYEYIYVSVNKVHLFFLSCFTSEATRSSCSIVHEHYFCLTLWHWSQYVILTVCPLYASDITYTPSHLNYSWLYPSISKVTISETSVSVYETSWCNIPEESHIRHHEISLRNGVNYVMKSIRICSLHSYLSGSFNQGGWDGQDMQYAWQNICIQTFD